MICSVSLVNQDQPTYIQTEAKITELDAQVSGRRSTATATVNFTTESGEDITSKVRLLSVPFLGTFKEVGDIIDIEYEANDPYVVKSKADSFLTKYGIYILIGAGVALAFKRFRKKESV